MKINNSKIPNERRFKMPRNSHDKKERINALEDAYNNIGKGGLYYMIDDTLCKEFGFNKFVPKPGNVFLAILPRPDSPAFFEQIYVHYDVGPNHYAFLCPNKMYDERCPVCERRKELSDKGEPDEVVKLYSWSSRVFMWVVNIENARSVGEGVYLYDAPLGVLKGIAGQTKDTRTGEIIDISDPVEDLELQFTRVGKDMHTKYNAYKTQRRGAEIPDAYYDDPIDMIDILIPPDIEAMEKALGIASRDTGRNAEPEYTRDPEPRNDRDRDRERPIDDDSDRDRDDSRDQSGTSEQQQDRGVERPRDDDRGRDRDDGRDRDRNREPDERERPRDDDRGRNTDSGGTAPRNNDRGRNDDPFPDKVNDEDEKRKRIRDRIENKRKNK